MNLFTKRFGLVLGGVVGVGAIAALAIGASFALFSATSAGANQTFTAGTVSLNSPTTGTCTVSNLEPGDTGNCNFTVNYGGSLPAYIGAEATANGVLAPELSFTIDGSALGSNPVLIGNSVSGSAQDPNGEVFTAVVGYTFSASADNSYQAQSAVVTVTFYAVQCSNNEYGSSAPNENCAGTPAAWANAPGVLYNSRIDYPAYQASMAYYATGLGELGNEVSLANGGGYLNNVVVDMANFNPVSGPMDITFNIYDPGSGGQPGSLIATDQQTFTIPAAPNGGYGSTYCTTGAGAGNPYCGIGNFSITFNFAPQDLTLPSTVIYGIQYDDSQNSVDSGVNVQLATEPTQVSVGADTFPGYVFAALMSGVSGQDAGPGEVTASTLTTTFVQVSTAVSGNYGMYPYIPAVQFNS